MKLLKTSAVNFPAADAFGEPVRVQGGLMRSCGDARLVESGGRFKLLAEGRYALHIETGSGHFKWKRGETPFAAGDTYLLEDAGEVEVNGVCVFLFAKE